MMSATAMQPQQGMQPQGDMQQQQQQMAAPGGQMRAAPQITTELIQKYLDENQTLILAILENQNLGKLNECAQYQARLQQNLMYLAAIADAQPQPQAQQGGQAPAGVPSNPPGQPEPTAASAMEAVGNPMGGGAPGVQGQEVPAMEAPTDGGVDGVMGQEPGSEYINEGAAMAGGSGDGAEGEAR